MEIKIEVGEERFKDVLEKELAAFSHEELHEICKKALLEQLSKPEVFRELFVSEGSGSYWSRDEKHYYANDLLKEAAKSVSFEETYKQIQDSIVAYINEHHSDIIKEMVTNMFVNGLASAVTQSENFKTRLSQEISYGTYNAVSFHEQQKHQNG